MTWPVAPPSGRLFWPWECPNQYHPTIGVCGLCGHETMHVGMPERIQLRRTKGWRKPEGAIVVTRATRWGNPFCVIGSGVAGAPWGIIRQHLGQRVWRTHAPEALYASIASNDSRTDAARHAVHLFRMLCEVFDRDHPNQFEGWISPLRGHDLACWCPLDEPCHADVLLELANR